MKLKLIRQNLNKRKTILKIKTRALLTKIIFNYQYWRLIIRHPELIKEKFKGYKKSIRKLRKIDWQTVLKEGKKIIKQPKKLAPYLIGLALIILLISFFPGKNNEKLQFKSTPRISNYLYQSKSKGFAVYLGNRDNKRTPKVGFVAGDSSVNLSLLNRVDEGVKFERINEKKVIYRNIHPEIDLIYTLTESGVKEEIKINSPETLSSLDKVLSFALDLNKAVPQKDLGGNLLPTFIDPITNEYRFHFEKPFMIDARDNKSYDISLSIKSSPALNQSTQYQAQFNPNLDWLKTALYPVIIDPTVVRDESSEFSGIKNRVKDTGSGSSPSIELYEQELTADVNTAGLWHMNEAANDSCSGGEDACDTSGNGNHGTATGTIIDTTTQKLGAAARSFNGSTDYINVTDSSSLEPPKITMESWIKITGDGSHSDGDYIITKGRQGSEPYFSYGLRYIPSSDLLSCKIGVSGTGRIVNSTDTFTPTTDWIHLACTYDGVVIKLYIDGELENEAFYSGDITYGMSTNDDLHIGDWGYGSFTRRFQGLIDEVKINGSVLTPEEIKQDAQKRPYGVYTSQSIDLGTSVSSLDSLEWSETTPSNTDLEFQTRTSANNSTWEEWKPTANETSMTTMDSDSSNWSWDSTATYMPQSKTDESTIKMEGTGSLKSTIGALQVDANTVGLWHFDETETGTGSTAYDSTTNNHHATTTGTSLGEGFYDNK